MKLKLVFVILFQSFWIMEKLDFMKTGNGQMVLKVNL